MACCAFVVFLLGQFAFVLERVRTFVFGEQTECGIAPHPAVSWSPALTAAALPMPPTDPQWPDRLRRLLSPELIALAVSVELLMGAGALTFFAGQAGYSPGEFARALAAICTSGHFTSL